MCEDYYLWAQGAGLHFGVQAGFGLRATTHVPFVISEHWNADVQRQ